MKGCLSRAFAFSQVQPLTVFIMTPTFGSRLVVAFSSASVALLMSCHADSISIINPSFEGVTGSDPAFFDSAGKLVGGHYTTGLNESHDSSGLPTADPTPGWKVSGGAGTINFYGTGKVSPPATDGNNVAWANGFLSAHGSLSQTLTTTYQAGLTYTLQVDAASFTYLPHADYSIGLYAGNKLVAGGINPTPLTPGTFITASISASIDASSPYVGQPISILLANAGNPPQGNAVAFDSVRLTSQVTTVPEPSTWALAALGLLGLLNFGRLKNRK
jgi:PEP-CTERM motif